MNREEKPKESIPTPEEAKLIVERYLGWGTAIASGFLEILNKLQKLKPISSSAPDKDLSNFTKALILCVEKTITENMSQVTDEIYKRCDKYSKYLPKDTKKLFDMFKRIIEEEKKETFDIFKVFR